MVGSNGPFPRYQERFARVKSRLIKTVHALKSESPSGKKLQTLNLRSLCPQWNAKDPNPPPDPNEINQTGLTVRDLLILKQACSPEYQGAQCAFKDLMIH